MDAIYPIYSEAALEKMSFNELADQCVNACVRRDPETARRIYNVDVQAKLRMTAEKDRKDAIIKAYRAQARMRQVLEDLFPECVEEERQEQVQAPPPTPQ